MGSLFKTSGAGYIPPTYTPVKTPSVQKNTTGEGEITEADQQIQGDEENVVRDIVRRQTRGRNSTIQTSYRGVLGDAGDAPIALTPQRKTLLGE